MRESEGLRDIRDTARRYLVEGLSIVPVQFKKPAVSSWKAFQTDRIALRQIPQLWPEPFGIAAICGAVSGGLEAIDCDRPSSWPEYVELIKTHAPGLFEQLVITQTPSGGFHLLYRAPNGERNQDLALESKDKKTFETRGEGGYIVLPSVSCRAHPSGKPYRVLQGDPFDIRMITADKRDLLIALARSFNEYEPRPKAPSIPEGAPVTNSGALRPGDDFNARGDVRGLLESFGWKVVGKRGRVSYLRRPGKRDGHSATLHAVGHNAAFFFTTDCHPFESGRKYSGFQLYTELVHQGDHKAAAKDLANQGYGEQRGLQRFDAAPDPTPSMSQAAEEYAAGLNQVVSRVLTAWGISDESKVTFFALHGMFGNRKVAKISSPALARHVRQRESEQGYFGGNEKNYENASQFGRRRLQNLRREIKCAGRSIIELVEKGGKNNPKTGLRTSSKYRLDMSIFNEALDRARSDPNLWTEGGPGAAIERAARQTAEQYAKSCRIPSVDAQGRTEPDLISQEQTKKASLGKGAKALFSIWMKLGLTKGEVQLRWRRFAREIEENSLQRVGSSRIAKYLRHQRLAGERNLSPPVMHDRGLDEDSSPSEHQLVEEVSGGQPLTTSGSVSLLPSRKPAVRSVSASGARLPDRIERQIKQLTEEE